MTQPPDPAALADAIRRGQLDLDALARDTHKWRAEDLHALCEALHLERLLHEDLRGHRSFGGAPAHGWITLCAKQARKPLTAWESWADDPVGRNGPTGLTLLGAYQDRNPDAVVREPLRAAPEVTWPWAWIRGVLAAVRAVASLSLPADLVARRWSSDISCQLGKPLQDAYGWLGLSEMEFPRASAYGLARHFLTDPEGESTRASQGLFVLGVIDGQGFAYRLKIDLLGDGCGRLYPVAEQSAVWQNRAFAHGLTAVEQYLRSLQLWPTDHDLRFSLKRVDGVATEKFKGASATAAFALAIARLLVGQGWPVPSTLTGLDDFDLSGVAVSAALKPDGALGPVEGLWPKLMDVKRLADDRRLHTVVVSDQQEAPPKDVASTADAGRNEPAGLSATGRLDVERAGNFPQLVARLAEAPWRQVRHWQRNTAKLRAVDPAVDSLDWDRHYQELGLFRELRQDELPKQAELRGPSNDDSGQDADPTDQPWLRELALRRWEEMVSQRRVPISERRQLDEVLTRFGTVTGLGKSVPRFFLLGPPGSGKTTLAYSLAHRTERWLPVVVRLVQWAAWAKAEWVEAKKRSRIGEDSPMPAPKRGDLARYLADLSCEKTHCEERRGARSREDWKKWWKLRLDRGDVLLLLDGLDELESHEAEWLEAALDYPNCAAIVTCRTVSWESWQRYKHTAKGEGLSVFYLDELGPAQWQGYINAYPAPQAGEAFPRAQLIAHLERTPQLHAIASTPQLLAMLCYLADDPHPDRHLDLPVTRGQLYERLVMRLLSDDQALPRGPAVTYPKGKTHRPETKRRWLAQAALVLFASEGERQLWFDCATWREAVKPALGDREALDDLADALQKDCLQRGLLRSDGARDFFLHLTVQEYLAAQALADQIRDAKQDWDAHLLLEALGEKRCTLRSFVSAKAWAPVWTEVIVLLAGLLEDPKPLLEMLMDEAQDDILGHRRTLACECLPELSESKRSTLVERIGDLAERTLRFEEMFRKEQGKWSARAQRALPPLATVGRRFRKERIGSWLATRVVSHLEDTNYSLTESGSGLLLPLPAMESGARAGSPRQA